MTGRKNKEDYELAERERKKRPSHMVRKSRGRENTANTVKKESVSDCHYLTSR